MGEDLTPRQQLLLWDLISRGGSALQKDLKPEVKPTDREPLVRAKMILATKRKNNAIELAVEERGWAHLSSNAPTLTKSGEGTKYDRPVLQFVLASLQAFAAAKAFSYADIFAIRDDGAIATPPLPIEAAIRSAFFEIAGRPARDGVRLSKLRDRLKDISRADLDATLLQMRKAGTANLMNLDNPRDIAAEGDAALRAGTQAFHIVWIEE